MLRGCMGIRRAIGSSERCPRPCICAAAEADGYRCHVSGPFVRARGRAVVDTGCARKVATKMAAPGAAGGPLLRVAAPLVAGVRNLQPRSVHRSGCRTAVSAIDAVPAEERPARGNAEHLQRMPASITDRSGGGAF